MSTYFIGAGIETYRSSPAGVSNSEDRVGFEGSTQPYYCDCIPRDPATGAQVALDDFWFHVSVSGDGARGRDGILMFNASDVNVIRLANTDEMRTQLRMLRNGSWQSIGDPVATGQNFVYDVRVFAHATLGRLTMCVNGTVAVDVEGIDTSQLAGINRIRLQSAIDGNASRYTYYSGSIIASYNTIGHTVRSRVPSGDFQNTGWTGGYADVDDSQNDDTDSVGTSVTGAQMAFSANGLSATPAGNVIKAVAVSARIRNDGGASPSGALAVLSIDGTDYVNPYGLPVGPGFSGAQTIFDKNPRTGQAWASITEVNQPFGLRATE